MGLEPTSQPWEGRILPMNYIRMHKDYNTKNIACKQKRFFEKENIGC